MNIEKIIIEEYGAKGLKLIAEKKNSWQGHDIYVAYYEGISGATMWFGVIDGQLIELRDDISVMIAHGYNPEGDLEKGDGFRA